MLRPEKVRPGLYAIHLILVKARYLVGAGVDPSKLHDVLDSAELLPALMARADDATDDFREMLARLGEKHRDFAGVVGNFDRNVSWIPTGELAGHELGAG